MSKQQLVATPNNEMSILEVARHFTSNVNRNKYIDIMCNITDAIVVTRNLVFELKQLCDMLAGQDDVIAQCQRHIDAMNITLQKKNISGKELADIHGHIYDEMELIVKATENKQKFTEKIIASITAIACTAIICDTVKKLLK